MSGVAKPITLEQCAKGVQQHLISENAHKVMQGFYLMQAQSVLSQRGSQKTHATVARVDYANADTSGFDVWLVENFQGIISRRTAANYITAAQNAGLTLEMSEKDAVGAVTEFLKRLAAEGKRLSDAYVKQLSDGEGGEGNQSTSRDVPLSAEERAKQLLMPWFEDVGRIAIEGSKEEKALYAMPEDEFLKAETYLRAALDTLKAVKRERGLEAKKAAPRAGESVTFFPIHQISV